MPSNQNLRRRFTLASLLLVTAIIGLFSVAMSISHEWAEDEILYTMMEREIADFASEYRKDHSHALPTSSQMHSYIVEPGQEEQLPPALRNLLPGIHHDLRFNDRAYQVANFSLEDKRFYLVYDITDLETREERLWWSLIVGGVLACLLGAVMARWLSGLAVAPVAELAGRIKQLDPGQPAPSLSGQFSGAEVGVIARAFDEHMTRLSEFIARERAFTEEASHELRTPIAVISTAAERLLGDSKLPDTLRPAVERMQRAAGQMQATSQALLFLARENESTSEMAQASLRSVIEEAVESHRYLLQPKKLELKLSLDGGEQPVPQALAGIVIANLLHNAISHTLQGHVELRLEGNILSVSDTGPGIAAQDLPHLFERQFRGGHSRGQGLGLYIAKRICDRLGWQIRVDSQPGQGSCFTLVFSAA